VQQTQPAAAPAPSAANRKAHRTTNSSKEEQAFESEIRRQLSPPETPAPPVTGKKRMRGMTHDAFRSTAGQAGRQEVVYQQYQENSGTCPRQPATRSGTACRRPSRYFSKGNRQAYNASGMCSTLSRWLTARGAKEPHNAKPRRVVETTIAAILFKTDISAHQQPEMKQPTRRQTAFAVFLPRNVLPTRVPQIFAPAQRQAAVACAI